VRQQGLFSKALLKLSVIYFLLLLIAVEGAKIPAGLAGQVRPRRSEATRRLSASSAESEAPGTKINSLIYEAF
jgi:hypothetical protein